jgi:hypothetical protein
VSACLDRANEASVLGFVLGHDKLAAVRRDGANALIDLREDVAGRRIEDLLCRIEAQAVQMKLLDPVGGVVQEKLAHRTCAWSVEIDGVAPFVFVAVREIGVGELAQVVAVRPEMIVDDVQDHAET